MAHILHSLQHLRWEILFGERAVANLAGSSDRGRNAAALRQRLLRNILQDFVHHG